MAVNEKKSKAGEERFVATGKSVTLITPGGAKKKTSKAIKPASRKGKR